MEEEEKKMGLRGWMYRIMRIVIRDSDVIEYDNKRKLLKE
jgi:hypothetical protein